LSISHSPDALALAALATNTARRGDGGGATRQPWRACAPLPASAPLQAGAAVAAPTWLMRSIGDSAVNYCQQQQQRPTASSSNNVSGN
jgi:hypothetical protein